MATEQNLNKLTFPAGADLRERQYRAVKKDANGELQLATAGARIDGILQDDPNDGESGVIAIGGRSKCYAGEAFDEDALLTPGANGVLVVCGTGDVPCGTATESAGASGDVVSMIVNPQLNAPT